MTDYKQYNYPWFPYAAETIASAGCGPTSCSDLLDIDPTKTAQWHISLSDGFWRGR